MARTRPSTVAYGVNAVELYLTPSSAHRPATDSVVVMVHASAWLLRHARIYNGWTLAEVAERCGVSMSTLSRAERARREPPLWLMLRICNVLGVRLSDVLRVAEDEAFPAGSGPWTDHPHAVLSHVGPIGGPPLPRGELGPEVLRDGSLVHSR